MDFKPVVFYINNQEYALDINQVQGIENVVPVVNVPNSNRNILGIINLRGEVIPVLSIRRKFNLPDAQATEESRFVIVGKGDIKLAIMVDKVAEIQAVEENAVFNLPVIVRTEETEYVKNIVNIKGRIVIVIGPEELLSHKEREALNQMLDSLK